MICIILNKIKDNVGVTRKFIFLWEVGTTKNKKEDSGGIYFPGLDELVPIVQVHKSRSNNVCPHSWLFYNSEP